MEFTSNEREGVHLHTLVDRERKRSRERGWWSRTALEVLKSLNTREDFKLEIGDVNILRSAINEMNLIEEDKENIIDLINKKSLINLKDYLENL